MTNVTIHYCRQDAKQAGFMPTSWLLSSNDRTPEICQGKHPGVFVCPKDYDRNRQ